MALNSPIGAPRVADASSRSLVRPGQASDLLFLSAVVVLSVVPYVWRLGFYSDDWASLAMMTSASDQSIAGLVKAQLVHDPDAAARLTNTVYQALLFHLFGLNPLGTTSSTRSYSYRLRFLFT